MHSCLNSAADHISRQHEILLYAGRIKTKAKTFGIPNVSHTCILMNYYSTSPHNKYNNMNFITSAGLLLT